MRAAITLGNHIQIKNNSGCQTYVANVTKI